MHVITVHSKSLCMVMWAVCDQLHLHGSYCIPVLVLHMCKHIAIHTCSDYVLYAGIVCQLSVQIYANANMRSMYTTCRHMQMNADLFANICRNVNMSANVVYRYCFQMVMKRSVNDMPSQGLSHKFYAM